MGTDGIVNAVVVGDVMLDSWLHGSAKRLAQEAPVPVMSLELTEDAPAAPPTPPPTWWRSAPVSGSSA
ncbi:hypothetical protein ACFQQB_21900 [Nonomuraea rubra]|uniref:hypothetical protein n=1 Tax=Nonomuraea rubra TaxID=46180 RepID=UPI00361A979F